MRERPESIRGLQCVLYLIRVGTTHLPRPSGTGALNIVFPGKNMHSDSQMSPNTLAKDVPISAKMTSEKRMGVFIEESRHRLIALWVGSVQFDNTRRNDDVLNKLIALCLEESVVRAPDDENEKEARNCGYMAIGVDK